MRMMIINDENHDNDDNYQNDDNRRRELLNPPAVAIAHLIFSEGVDR